MDKNSISILEVIEQIKDKSITDRAAFDRLSELRDQHTQSDAIAFGVWLNKNCTPIFSAMPTPLWHYKGGNYTTEQLYIIFKKELDGNK